MIHRRHRMLPVVLTLVYCLALGCAGTATAQTPKKKRNPALKTAMKDLMKAVHDHNRSKDDVAKEIMTTWLGRFDDMHEADKAAFAKGLGEVLISNRTRRKPNHADIFRTAIVALGQCGKYGSEYLVKAFENKSKFKDKDWLALKSEMLEHVGRTEDPRQVEFLLHVALTSFHDTFMAKAGGTLQHYAELPLKTRKPIAKRLIKKFAQIYNNANKNLDPGDAVVRRFKDRLAEVSDSWITALQKLTKQHLRSANHWNKFWNKHKGDDWDKPLKTQ